MDNAADWIDITTVADWCEIQMDVRSSPTRYRHRRRGDADWTTGQPPLKSKESRQ